jgi:hypothetical protein
MAESEKQQLSRDALLGILACIVGIGGVVFELGWVTRSLLVLFVIGLTIYATRRHSAHLILRTAIAIIVILVFVGLSASPIWQDFHKKNPNVVFRWPVTFGGSERTSERSDPPDMPPLDLPGPPLSKWGKVLYICPFPPKVDAEKREALKAALRRNADIYGTALGVAFIFNEIPYGIRFDITAKNAEGETHMGGVQRVTIQLEVAPASAFPNARLCANYQTPARRGDLAQA